MKNKSSDDQEKQENKPSLIQNLAKNSIAPLASLSSTPPASGSMVGVINRGTDIDYNSSALLGNNVGVQGALRRYSSNDIGTTAWGLTFDRKRSHDVFSEESSLSIRGGNSNYQLIRNVNPNVPPVNPYNFLLKCKKDIHSPQALFENMMPSHPTSSSKKEFDPKQLTRSTELVNSIVVPFQPYPTLVLNKDEPVHLQPQKCQAKEAIVDKAKEHATKEREVTAANPRPAIHDVISNLNVVDPVGKYRVPDLNFPPPDED
ncbi:hypothetical protein RND71_033930 [Anisodus tanguticus]|uniref:Uncharacterized protein n=1 Tax=Anisodus tanguticus TaxID=243964 RepID=A0AAE1V1Z4_9SOLA|nr:hypothetical protein RND71_033930 [Anisodus tanguticus]